MLGMKTTNVLLFWWSDPNHYDWQYSDQMGKLGGDSDGIVL